MFRQIERSLLERMKATIQTIAISANFTIEPISRVLENVIKKVSFDSTLEIAPYNQIVQQLLDPGSSFNKNESGANVIFLRIEDLVEGRTAGSKIGINELKRIKRNASDLAERLVAAKQFTVPLFVFICPASRKIHADPKILSEFEEIGRLVHLAGTEISNLYVFGTDHLASRYKIETQDNLRGNELGHLPYTEEFYSALAIETARKIDAYRRKSFKVLVLDCDNTLWDGVVGEDGVKGIGLSDSRLLFQKFAVRQSESGLVVCLCSKNNESEVWEVFDQRPEMQLRREHIVSSRINWLPKSENLRSISKELQLGLESFIFVDDDPVVCSEVRMNCPEVFTVQLPPESDDQSAFFDHLWVFDKLKETKEDRQRTRSYQNQVVRNKLQANAGDMAEFLKSLELVCEISEMQSEEISRVSQLSLRTNQFNSTTVRFNESDVGSLISELKKNIWTVKVSDRFGDYGLVGVVIFEEKENSLQIDSFMLSCRVLGRGVEHRILQELGKKAVSANLTSVDIKFQPTTKNVPIFNFLNEIAVNYETPDKAGQMTYRVPAEKTIECFPKMNPVKTNGTQQAAPGKSANVTNGSLDSGQFQTYLELAESLSSGISLVSKAGSSVVLRRELQTEFQEARSDSERKLIQIWEKLLNKKNIGTADNFFEIGGDSMLAVSLIVEIEEEFGKTLPLSILIDSPTIGELCQGIEAENEVSKWKYIVPINSEGLRIPLFCLHAAGGNVLFYRDLASELGRDQPVYGLQMRGVSDKSETAHDRIEEMASEYLREIRIVQPQGPYRLCGSSFGGLVAFECAKQLCEAGEPVSVLALIDTYAPGYLSNYSSKFVVTGKLYRVFGSVKKSIDQLKRIGSWHEQFDFILSRGVRIKQRLIRQMIWKKNEFSIQYSKATGRDLPTDLLRNHKAIRRAEESYDPKPYGGTIVLFRASDQPQDVAFDAYLGWKKYSTRAIVTEDVKGPHGAIAVYSFATELAQKLGRYLGPSENLAASATATSTTLMA